MQSVLIWLWCFSVLGIEKQFGNSRCVVSMGVYCIPWGSAVNFTLLLLSNPAQEASNVLKVVAQGAASVLNLGSMAGWRKLLSTWGSALESRQATSGEDACTTGVLFDVALFQNSLNQTWFSVVKWIGPGFSMGSWIKSNFFHNQPRTYVFSLTPLVPSRSVWVPRVPSWRFKCG